MEKKPNLIHYFVAELRWAAATSREWLRLLFRDRQAAMQALRAGARSPEFRKRAGLWYAATSFSFNRMRVTAPMLVGVATGLYYALNQTSLISSLAFGLLAGVVTHMALGVLPFALIASAPVLAFLCIRAILPANLPEPGEREAQVTAEFRNAVDAPSSGETQGIASDASASRREQPATGAGLLSEENRMSPNDALASKFDGSDQPFLLRLMMSDGSVVLRDPAEIEIVSKWIQRVRTVQSEMTLLNKAVGRLSRLDGVVSHAALFELGILDRASFRKEPVPRRNRSDLANAEASVRLINGLLQQGLADAKRGTNGEIFEDGSNGADQVDEQAEPRAPPGKDKYISPRGHGYVFMSTFDLKSQEPPSLTCDVVREIVLGYVTATQHAEMMQAFRGLKKAGSDPQAFLSALNRDRGINLDDLQEQVLAREVRDTAAQRLAKCYAESEKGVQEYKDFIARQQKIARLAFATLTTAHKAVQAADSSERQARIAARANRPSQPYLDAAAIRTSVKTTEQRRAELEALIRRAIPTERREW